MCGVFEKDPEETRTEALSFDSFLVSFLTGLQETSC